MAEKFIDVVEGVEDELPPDNSTTYTVVQGGSKRGKDKLVDSD